MNISRSFMLVGSVFLILGILLGMYMGGSGNHTLAPVHAHINLLGFTLMMVFGLTSRAMPAMAGNMLATVHFWLHLVGSAVLVVMLFMLFSGMIVEARMAPVAPIAEALVFIGVLTFAWNLLRNGK